MKIGFVTRKNAATWGGDLAALYAFYEGLREIGADVVLGRTAEEIIDADFIFLSNTSLDLQEDYAAVCKARKRFGIIAFHADRSHFFGACYGFAHFVGLCLKQQKDFRFHRIEQLIENPNVIDAFPYLHSPLFEENFPILAEAEVCIATSFTERATLLRDCPSCRAEVIYLESGIPGSCVDQRNPAFLQWTGLAQGEYVLQVGRIEQRKNQLASILAMHDLPMPLVFIATESFYPQYEQMCLQAIKTWRAAPTLVISQHLESRQEGSLRILRMPEGKKLSREMLISAYQNAGAHLHPAFCELPGLTYLEAAKLRVPTVASTWTTVSDYFADPKTGQSTLDERIVYSQPHHIQKLTELLQQQWGKTFNGYGDHPAFRRTKADMAQDLLAILH